MLWPTQLAHEKFYIVHLLLGLERPTHKIFPYVVLVQTAQHGLKLRHWASSSFDVDRRREYQWW